MTQLGDLKGMEVLEIFRCSSVIEYSASEPELRIYRQL